MNDPGPPPAPDLPDAAGGGKLVDNIMMFGRTLRAAGLPVGPGKVLDAIRAVEVNGITDRTDFYWTLHAVFVNRRDQREVFDQAFHVFWRNPRLLERMLQMILPEFRSDVIDEDQEQMNRRVAEAMAPQKTPNEGDDQAPKEENIDFDAAMTWSDKEMLREMDFEKMSAEEVARAKQAVRDMRLPIMEVKTSGGSDRTRMAIASTCEEHFKRRCARAVMKSRFSTSRAAPAIHHLWPSVTSPVP